MIDIREHGGGFGGKSPVKIRPVNKFTYDYSYIKTRTEHQLHLQDIFPLTDFREVLYQDEQYLVYSTNSSITLGIYDKFNFLNVNLPSHPNICLSVQRKGDILRIALYTSINNNFVHVTKFDLVNFVMLSTVRYAVSQLTGNANTGVSILGRFGDDYFACIVRQTNNYYVAIVSLDNFAILVKTMIGTTTNFPGVISFSFATNGQDNRLYSKTSKIITSLHDGTGANQKLVEIEILIDGSFKIRYIANGYEPSQVFEWQGKKVGTDGNNLFIYDDTMSTIISNQKVLFPDSFNRPSIEIDKFNNKLVVLNRMMTAPNRVQILDFVNGVIVSEFYTPVSSLQYEPSGIIYNHYNQFKVYEFRTANQSTRAPAWDQLIYGKIKMIK